MLLPPNHGKRSVDRIEFRYLDVRGVVVIDVAERNAVARVMPLFIGAERCAQDLVFLLPELPQARTKTD